MADIKQSIIRLLIAVLLGVLTLFSVEAQVIKTSSPAENADSVLKRPYLILISLDGFRWDYVERFNPPHLRKFINTGVKAESLIPSFPSKTFPNHYTIATGMYPDKHGLLGNTFYSYKKKKAYNIRDRSVVKDGSYYNGTPIWVQAAKAGMVTASYFFVGTEADVQGMWPTYYYDFDARVKNEDKVTQALQWLAMPERERPHLITMYFSDMDNRGHQMGPNDDEALKEALHGLDKSLGSLFEGIEKTGLPVNVIIVSDHGMKEIPLDKYIPTEMVKNDELYMTIDNGSILNIHPKNEDDIDSIYQNLKEKENHFSVYKTEDTPNFEYVPVNKDWGAIQVLPDDGYYFTGQRKIGMLRSSSRKVFGQHGLNPELQDMHGIFYANGPHFKKGYVIPSVKNIHIYPLMCELLGLEVPDDVDGKLNELKGILAQIEFK